MDAAASLTAGDCPFGAPDSRGSGRLRARMFPESVEPPGRVSFARSHGTAELGSSPAPSRPLHGAIDVEIFGKMAADGVRPTVRSSDAEYLRRVTLDLVGQIPDAAMLAAFVADGHADKRARLVENLLRSDAFNDRWTMWLGDLLENVRTTAANGVEQPQGRNALYASSARRSPRRSPTTSSSGSSSPPRATASPPARRTSGCATWPRWASRRTRGITGGGVREKFLGMQINCTGCHNGAGHTDAVNLYLSTKTRMDFWKNAAFFAQTTVTAVTDTPSGKRKYVLADNTTGAYALNTKSGNRPPRQPDSGQSNKVAPAFYLTGETPRAGKSLRAEYARMLTAHPQFARAAVNYLFKEMFGIGIVEPADGFDLYRLDPNALPPGQTPQPSHPALLTQLANEFVSSGYDLRSMLRAMANSEAYQLSARYTPGPWNETFTRYFARRVTRRMTSEQLLDAVFTASGVEPTNTGNDMLTVTRLPRRSRDGAPGYDRGRRQVRHFPQYVHAREPRHESALFRHFHAAGSRPHERREHDPAAHPPGHGDIPRCPDAEGHDEARRRRGRSLPRNPFPPPHRDREGERGRLSQERDARTEGREPPVGPLQQARVRVLLTGDPEHAVPQGNL